MKRLREFIESAFITLQAIFVVVAVILTEVLNQRNLQLTFIEALLCMIVLDFFLLFTNRLRKLTDKVGTISSALAHRGVGVEFVDRNTFDWRAAVQSARNDIFMSGTTLTNLVPGKDVFVALDSRVTTRFLLLDVAQTEVLEGFRRMRYADATRHSQQRYLNQANLFKDFYRALRDLPNMRFAVSDRIMPMAFVAIDIHRLSANSLIKVQHYLHENEADRATVSYVVRPGNPVYSLYVDQITMLWDAATTTNTYLETP